MILEWHANLTFNDREDTRQVTITEIEFSLGGYQEPVESSELSQNS